MTTREFADSALEPFSVSARTALAAAMFIGCAALAAAFTGQHVFGMQPCVLCIWQRIPFAVVVAIGACALLCPVGSKARAWSVVGVAVVFAGGAALAFYHVGVEERWWGSFAACSGQSLQELSFEDLGQPTAIDKPCDQVDWRFLGLSLAGYNAIMSAGAALVFAALGRMIVHQERP